MIISSTLLGQNTGTISFFKTSGSNTTFLYINGEPISMITGGQRVVYTFTENANLTIEAVNPYNPPVNPNRKLEYGDIKVPIGDKAKGGLGTLNVQAQVDNNYYISVTGSNRPEVDFATSKKFNSNKFKAPPVTIKKESTFLNEGDITFAKDHLRYYKQGGSAPMNPNVTTGASTPQTGNSISQTSNSSMGTSNGGGISMSRNFEPVTVVENFRFEFQELKREGEKITMFFKVTNLEPEDRTLKFTPCYNRFFDSNGNEITNNSVICISDKCNRYWSKQRYSTNDISNMMPSGIPMNLKVSANGVSKEAKSFIRADIPMAANGVATKWTLNNIVFPETTIGPNTAIYGDFLVNWVGVKKKGTQALAHFTVTNRAGIVGQFNLGNAIAYDDQGNQYSFSKAAFGNEDNPLKAQDQIAPQATQNFYMPINNINNNATALLRISLNIGSATYDFKQQLPISQ